MMMGASPAAASSLSADTSREDELLRQLRPAIRDILALDREPSGRIQTTRTFNFDGYEVSVCARYDERETQSARKRPGSGDENTRLSPDERHIQSLEALPKDSEAWKTLWNDAMQQSLVLGRLGIPLDVCVKPVLTPTTPAVLFASVELFYKDVSSSLSQLVLANSESDHLSVAPLTTLPLLSTIESLCSTRTINPDFIPLFLQLIARNLASMTLVPTCIGSIDTVPEAGRGVPLGLKGAGDVVKEHAKVDTDLVGGYMKVAGRYVPWMAKLSTKELVLVDKGWSEEGVRLILGCAIEYAYPQNFAGGDVQWIITSGSHITIQSCSVMIRTLLAMRHHGMHLPTAVELGLGGLWQTEVDDASGLDETVTGLWCLNLLQDATRVMKGYHQLLKRVAFTTK